VVPNWHLRWWFCENSCCRTCEQTPTPVLDSCELFNYRLLCCIRTLSDHRFTTVRRRTAHRLAKLQARDHLVQGLLAALRRVDDIIHVMKTSNDAAQARDELISPTFGFSAEQVLWS
jgi:DNA gyrase/topoisomerase IV subunit A